MVDLENYDDKQRQKFERVMNGHREFGKEVYISPFEKFIEEYRVYFTKLNEKIKIYSLKKKTVTSPEEDIIKAENFEYYTNVMIKWEYIENKEWRTTRKELIKASKEYIKKLEYTTGALEFGKTED